MEKWVALVMLLLLYLTLLMEAKAEVTYDGRSLVIDGHRKILFSGSIHYPRSTPQMWPNLIEKAKEGGVDVIQTYVFWNLHEPQPGQYDFSGRYDLVRFIKEIQAQGLYVCLRIGPYIESEWTYGGFPFWLHDVPGIVYRTNNEPFKYYMQNFTTKIVSMMKSEGLYAAQGGPIILSQIENEYENIEKPFGEEGSRYVGWAAEMAVGLQTGVPWVMCKQNDAPDPVINTCNGMKCGETFTGPNSPNKPSLWTENWTSFYQVYGGVPYIRSAEDIAFHVTLFIARKNGSYVNYYMYHGGTNFGRSSSAYVITSYYDQAPLDEYGLLRQPKWGHLKELHAAIKYCSTTLLQGIQTNFSLGQMQEGYVFEDGEGECVAFLVNHDSVNKVTVQFQNRSYELLPKSISILPDCQNVTFNTATVNTKSNKRIINPVQSLSSADKWEQFQDAIPNFEDTLSISNQLLDHMNLTKDKSDYLWYTLRFEHNSPCNEPILHFQSAAHVAHAFVDDTYIGGAHGNHDVKSFTLDLPITLNEGANNISILSVMVGLPDSGAFLERRFAGLTSVEIQCSEESYDLTNSTWGYQVGLLGEQLQIYEEQNSSPVEWSQIGNTINQRLTWFKTAFDSPEGDDPVALNLGSMGKGETWVNGQSIGRYWILFHDSKGQPSQALYHVPRSFLKNTGNILVVFEEGGGDPLHISINTVSTTYLDDTISK